MKKRQFLIWLLLLVLIAVLAGQAIAHAQTGGGYDLTWHLAGGAGGAMSGGAYTLAGSAGQAGASILSGGGYTLNGGFWVSDWHPSNWLYLPLTLKGGS